MLSSLNFRRLLSLADALPATQEIVHRWNCSSMSNITYFLFVGDDQRMTNAKYAQTSDASIRLAYM